MHEKAALKTLFCIDFKIITSTWAHCSPEEINSHDERACVALWLVRLAWRAVCHGDSHLFTPRAPWVVTNQYILYNHFFKWWMSSDHHKSSHLHVRLEFPSLKQEQVLFQSLPGGCRCSVGFLRGSREPDPVWVCARFCWSGQGAAGPSLSEEVTLITHGRPPSLALYLPHMSCSPAPVYCFIAILEQPGHVRYLQGPAKSLTQECVFKFILATINKKCCGGLQARGENEWSIRVHWAAERLGRESTGVHSTHSPFPGCDTGLFVWSGRGDAGFREELIQQPCRNCLTQPGGPF